MLQKNTPLLFVVPTDFEDKANSNVTILQQQIAEDSTSMKDTPVYYSNNFRVKEQVVVGGTIPNLTMWLVNIKIRLSYQKEITS